MFGIPFGEYRVIVRAPGFLPDYAQGVKPTIAADSEISFQLKPGQPDVKLPFEMSQEEIQACLQNLAAGEEYKDIRRLSTSAGTVFLYSTLHLDPAHASMLAEWIDVGQSKSP
jgi:hypothetical protein